MQKRKRFELAECHRCLWQGLEFGCTHLKLKEDNPVLSVAGMLKPSSEFVVLMVVGKVHVIQAVRMGAAAWAIVRYLASLREHPRDRPNPSRFCGQDSHFPSSTSIG